MCGGARRDCRVDVPGDAAAYTSSYCPCVRVCACVVLLLRALSRHHLLVSVVQPAGAES